MRISDWSSDVCSSDLRDSTGAPTLDPALADALADPILVDPDLGQQANGDALRPPDRPPSGGLPPVDIAPIAPAAAPSRHAPEPDGDCAECTTARQARPPGALAAAQSDPRDRKRTRLNSSPKCATRNTPSH